MHVCLNARSFFRSAHAHFKPTIQPSTEERKETQSMIVRKAVDLYWKQAALVMIVVSCSQGGPDDPTIKLGTETGGDSDWGAVAKASVNDAGGGANAQPDMPMNPSHITIRIPKVPDVNVTLLGGAPCPYPFEVAEENDHLVVTLYVPQGEVQDISVRPLDEAGKLLGEAVNVTVEPDAKLGTNALELGGSHTIISFEDDAQCPMQMGDNTLDGPVTTEYIDGEDREVIQGLYVTDVDRVCRVSWQGAEKVYSFLNSEPVCHTEPFDIELEAGQALGLYPVILPEAESVKIHLESP